jgi:hypothetical protein
MEKLGFYSKYVIHKSNGKPTDPKAVYFVLRLDTDEAARKSALVYADNIDNKELSQDLKEIVKRLRRK